MIVFWEKYENILVKKYELLKGSYKNDCTCIWHYILAQLLFIILPEVLYVFNYL